MKKRKKISNWQPYQTGPKWLFNICDNRTTAQKKIFLKKKSNKYNVRLLRPINSFVLLPLLYLSLRKLCVNCTGICTCRLVIHNHIYSNKHTHRIRTMKQNKTFALVRFANKHGNRFAFEESIQVWNCIGLLIFFFLPFACAMCIVINLHKINWNINWIGWVCNTQVPN